MRQVRTGPLLILVATFATVLVVTTSAYAQGFGGSGMGGGGHGRHHAKTDKTTVQKPKIDEKAYDAALKNLPDKQYDPWHGVR
jgi:hypothetical protein